MATEEPTITRHPVYRTINKPLLFCGVERRYFFVAVVLGAVVFNMFQALIVGLIIFAVAYAFAHWATKTDPEILPIMIKPILNPQKFRPVLDPGKLNRSNIHLERTR